MLDDTTKAYIMLDIKCLTPDDVILEQYNISNGTLKVIKNEYERIKQMLVGLKSISEIADSIKTTEDYIETIRHIIETDADQLLDEVEQTKKDQQDAVKADTPQEDPPPKEEIKESIDADVNTNTTTDTDTQTDTRDDEDIRPENNGKEKKQGRPKKKDTSGSTQSTKEDKIESKLKKTAETETAAVLVNDAGEMGKSLTIQRQDIGKFVMENMGTVAMQYGYRDFKEFLNTIFTFFIENYGRIDDMAAEIDDLNLVNQQLQETIDQDIFRIFIAKSLDRVTIAALIGGGKLNLETLFAYKRMLESSGEYNNNGGLRSYGN